METKIIKKWIRGNKERGSEVIKILEDLGGINTGLLGDREDMLYYIRPTNMQIESFREDTNASIFLMWAGEEIKLPEQIECNCSFEDCICKINNGTCPHYFQAKFKVGDIVLSGNDKCLIKRVCASRNGVSYKVWPYNEKIQDFDEDLSLGINERHLKRYTPEPKFKVGDKVKYFVVTGNDVFTISKVEYTFDKYYYYFEGKNGCYEEKYLQPANTLKEFDPVMVSEDGKTWKPAIYNTHSTVYMLLEENDSASKSYKYIVPLSDFDFHNLESNIERSVV